MVKLHLVGFTTDLKNLIFARRKGARSGGFMVAVDARLKRTLEEIARLEAEASENQVAPDEAPAPVENARAAKLTPKQIQSLLREGRSVDHVARLAETDVEWIQRFTPPILAERAGVIDAVRASTISKPRLGPSAATVGDAVAANLDSKKVSLEREEFEQAWQAVRRDGSWVVSFTYRSRGTKRLARYSYRPETKEVTALNDVATDIGWLSQPAKPGARRKATKPATSKRAPSKRAAPKRAAPKRAAPKRAPKKKAAAKKPAAKRTAGRAKKPARR